MTEMMDFGDSESFPNAAAQTLNSLQSKVAGTEKSRRIEISAVTFLSLMQDLGGTFVWEDGPKRGHKFSSVFEALAAKMPGFDELGLSDKAAHVYEYAPTLKSGFYSARKWLGQWYMRTVYAVPQHKESGVLTVITLDPDYKLESGHTASEMQATRDFKLADGQMRASTRRLAASVKNKDAVNSWLSEIVQRAQLELEDMRPLRQ